MHCILQPTVLHNLSNLVSSACRYAPDESVAALLDQQFSRVGGGGAAPGGRDRDRSGMPAYGGGAPGQENTWYQGPRTNPGTAPMPADGSRVYFKV